MYYLESENNFHNRESQVREALLSRVLTPAPTLVGRISAAPSDMATLIWMQETGCRMQEVGWWFICGAGELEAFRAVCFAAGNFVGRISAAPFDMATFSRLLET